MTKKEDLAEVFSNIFLHKGLMIINAERKTREQLRINVFDLYNAYYNNID